MKARLHRRLLLLATLLAWGLAWEATALAGSPNNTSDTVKIAQSGMPPTPRAQAADVNAADQYGTTALMRAAAKGEANVVTELLAKGADVNAKENDNTTALMLAAQNNHPDVVKILLASRAEVNARNARGVTVLMWAAEHGKLDLIQMVLDRGADVNLKADDGKTALMFASKPTQLDVMQTLLARNANVNAKDNQGKTAIDMIAKDNLTARNLLITAGAFTATKNPNLKGVWKGHLGTQEITACFQLDDDDLFELGVYYYAKFRQPIKLELDKDIIQADSSLLLHETNGAWNLTMAGNDTLAGTWSDQGKHYAMNLVRVPVANKDEIDAPCRSAEFNSGRKLKPQFVFAQDTINGSPYRTVTDKNTEGVTSFELVGKGEFVESVNQQLRKDLAAEIDEAFDCTNSVLGRFGEQGDYSSTTRPIFITRHWLSVTISIEESCGGAHPNSVTRYQLWNLETGKLDDIWTWFNKSGAQQQNGYFQAGPKLAAMLAKLWPNSADSGADHDCDDAESLASWNMHPDAGGLVFSAELPHVIQACADDVSIPYSKLMPLLNAHGKAAAASLSADLAK